MDFTTCRTQFDEYVADTLKVGVYLQGAGDMTPMTAPLQGDVEVRVVVSNHPGGQPDTTAQENPPNGVNFNDVRLHIAILADEPTALLVVPENAEYAYFRSGWEVADAVLTPGDVVNEIFIHFDPRHPTFDLPTDDVLDDFIVTARTQSTGTFTVSAVARVTPRWRTIGTRTSSAVVTVE